MDVASTLKVLGCQAVTCVAREELDEFPASEKEFTSAISLVALIICIFTVTSRAKEKAARSNSYPAASST